jgi:hypothetical protein
MTGPFRGLRYSHGSVCGAYLPRLIGCYERELQPILDEIFQIRVETIVDIGAAEGYYACGLALRFPTSRIVAFETDEEARRLLTRVADDNGVLARLDIRGHCDENGFLACLDPKSTLLVLCDCEGGEAEILSPLVVGELANAHVIVETHDLICPGVHQLLKARFAATHKVVDISPEPRSMADWPVESLVCRTLFKARILRLLQERPPNTTRWLYAKPGL